MVCCQTWANGAASSGAIIPISIAHHDNATSVRSPLQPPLQP